MSPSGFGRYDNFRGFNFRGFMVPTALLIRIEPDDVDRGMKRLDQYRQVSRTASYFKNTLTRLEVRLVDQLPVRGLARPST